MDHRDDRGVIARTNHVGFFGPRRRRSCRVRRQFLAGGGCTGLQLFQFQPLEFNRLLFRSQIWIKANAIYLRGGSQVDLVYEPHGFGAASLPGTGHGIAVEWIVKQPVFLITAPKREFD